MATAGEPAKARRGRATSTSAWLTAVLALGVASCGDEDAALGVTSSNDDGTQVNDAGTLPSDAASDESVATNTAVGDAGMPSGTDTAEATDESDDPLPEVDAAADPNSDSDTEAQTEPPTVSEPTTIDVDDAGVRDDEVEPADAATSASDVEIVEQYAETGYCSVYVEQGERGHRLDCTFVLGEVWSCNSFTPVEPYAEFYIADSQRYTVAAPAAQDVCSLLVEPLFAQGPSAFVGDEDDCEQMQGSDGPSRWQAEVCGPQAMLNSEIVAWEGEPELLATCERPATQSVAAICGCGQTAIERQYMANEGADLMTALAATWTYCSAPGLAALSGSLTCDPNPSSTQGTNLCGLETTCSQPEQLGEVTAQRHFAKRILCEPVPGAVEPSVSCVCDGVIDGVASVSFPAEDNTLATCESVFELCKPGPLEISGPAECTLVDDYLLEDQGCGVALSCTVPLLFSGAAAETTLKADLYCNKISDTTVSCSSNTSSDQPLFEVTEVDFETACATAIARFEQETEQTPPLP